MRFGPLPLADAEGALLAHSLALNKGRLRKGHKLAAPDIRALDEAGYETVIVARLDPDDVPENEAAFRLAQALAAANLRPGNPGTGRCNLYAGLNGLLIVDNERVNRFNLVDEAITLATVSPHEPVAAGRIAATVKIIPFAVPEAALTRCIALAHDEKPILSFAPFRSLRAGLIQTRLPGMKAALIGKTIAVTRERLAAIGSRLVAARVCTHDEAAVGREIRALKQRCDLILLLGASAIVDRRDVVPAAIVASGGGIVHFGMPVDPGNLTLVARIGPVAVLGLPGSARSPRTHGFDYVLQRLAAGIDIKREDIMRMGVGGLLKEMPGRPMPRERGAAAPQDLPRVAAVVLAAGRSTRMVDRNKLLVDINGQPLVRRVVESLAKSGAAEIVVVTGHEREKVEAALAGLAVRIAHNPDYAKGLSTSLKAGIAALGRGCAGAVFCLGDMPEIAPAMIDRLIAAFAAGRSAGRDIAVPVVGRKQGNPVLLGRRHFRALRRIIGDVGARDIVQAKPEAVIEVDAADGGIFLDLDTPEALAAYRTDKDAAAACGRH